MATLSSFKVLVDRMRGGVTDSYPVAIYVFWGWEKSGVRLRHAQGLMGRDEGKIAVAIFPSSLPTRPRARLNLTPNLLSPPKHINSDWVRVWWYNTFLAAAQTRWWPGTEAERNTKIYVEGIYQTPRCFFLLTSLFAERLEKSKMN